MQASAALVIGAGLKIETVFPARRRAGRGCCRQLMIYRRGAAQPQPNCAKRMECVELAPAFEPPPSPYGSASRLDALQTLPAAVELPKPSQLARNFGCGSAASSEGSDKVAQIFNLPYRRFVIGRVADACWRFQRTHPLQNAILRDSRLKICATLSTAAASSLLMPESGCLAPNAKYTRAGRGCL